LIFAAVVMLITSVPYVLGYVVQDEDWRFTGFVISVEDGNAFIGKMLSGSVGEWLFRTPYTATPQRGFLIFLPYILLGKLVQPTDAHEPLVALYHLFRIGAGGLAILATYQFISLFVAKTIYRRIGLALSTLGGGLGWLLVALGKQQWLGFLPLDFYSPESFGFLSLYAYPHYALARALLLWGLAAYLRATVRLDSSRSLARGGLKVGLLWLLAGLAQPLTGMVVIAIVGLYLLALAAWQGWLAARRKEVHWPGFRDRVLLAVWAGIPPAPFVLYNLASTRLDPFLKMWTEQSPFPSPHPLHYLLAYALVLPFAVPGARQLWREKEWSAKLPVVWAICLPILAYAPVSVQRRLPEGVWVALVILALKGLGSSTRPATRRWAAMLLLSFPSTLLLLVGGILEVADPGQTIYRPADEVAAFQALSGQTQRDTVVLSSYESGNALPAWAPVFVVVGHGPESVGYSRLMPRVEAFYKDGTADSERLELLTELGVDYVFWGPHEKALGGWDPSTADYLSQFHRSGDYFLFSVR
jgi:hypothetical protein